MKNAQKVKIKTELELAAGITYVEEISKHEGISMITCNKLPNIAQGMNVI
ncbi:MAG: hypothetical protein V1874_13810 [Spirochaetota bacterium]